MMNSVLDYLDSFAIPESEWEKELEWIDIFDNEKFLAKALAPNDFAPKYTAFAFVCTAAFKHSKSPTGESNSIIFFIPFYFNVNIISHFCNQKQCYFII